MSTQRVAIGLTLVNVGRPGVKIAASEQASGLSFVGASDSTQVQLGAQGGAASLKLANHDGRQQVFRP